MCEAVFSPGSLWRPWSWCRRPPQTLLFHWAVWSCSPAQNQTSWKCREDEKQAQEFQLKSRASVSVLTVPAWCSAELWRLQDPPQIVYCPRSASPFLPVSVRCDAPLYCWGHTHKSYHRVPVPGPWGGGPLLEDPAPEGRVPRSGLLHENKEEKPWGDVGWRTERMSLRRHVRGLWEGQRRRFQANKYRDETTTVDRLVPDFLLTVLTSGRSNIPDARGQLALSSLVGWVTRAIAGAPPLFPVMFGSSFFSDPTGSSTAAGPGPVHTHHAEPLPGLLLVAVVQHWQTTLLVTDGEMRKSSYEEVSHFCWSQATQDEGLQCASGSCMLLADIKNLLQEQN